jgi:hypothetical protein
MAKLHYANKLANLLCNVTNELVGLWQDQRPTSCTACRALVLLEPNISTGHAEPSKLANKLHYVRAPLISLKIHFESDVKCCLNLYFDKMDGLCVVENTQIAEHIPFMQ